MPYSGPLCRICGVPIVSEHADICGRCIESPPYFEQAVSFGMYEDVLASAIHQFKFIGIRRLHVPLTDLLLHHDTGSIDAIIPVPLSHSGLLSRGFNQTLLLADRLARQKKIPLIMDCLMKTRETPPQVGLSAEERMKNMKKAFTCVTPLNGKRILLIDDVMTTGATVNECAKELKKAGAASVSVLALARAGKI
jgi:ComF family protein